MGLWSEWSRSWWKRTTSLSKSLFKLKQLLVWVRRRFRQSEIIVIPKYLFFGGYFLFRHLLRYHIGKASGETRVPETRILFTENLFVQLADFLNQTIIWPSKLYCHCTSELPGDVTVRLDGTISSLTCFCDCFARLCRSLLTVDSDLTIIFVTTLKFYTGPSTTMKYGRLI